MGRVGLPAGKARAPSGVACPSHFRPEVVLQAGATTVRVCGTDSGPWVGTGPALTRESCWVTAGRRCPLTVLRACRMEALAPDLEGADAPTGVASGEDVGSDPPGRLTWEPPSALLVEKGACRYLHGVRSPRSLRPGKPLRPLTETPPSTSKAGPALHPALKDLGALPGSHVSQWEPRWGLRHCKCSGVSGETLETRTHLDGLQNGLPTRANDSGREWDSQTSHLSP